MKNIIAILIAICCTVTVFAQTEKETSDPEAKAILEKMRTKYEAYQTLGADFILTIEIPEEEKEVQSGSIAQHGDKYRVDLEHQAVYSDGNSLWLYMKNSNEVQINDVDDFEEDGEMLSPKDLLRIYEKEDFIYQLINEDYENGVAIQQIEFKPTDRDSEYAKMRVTIDQKKMQIKRIKAFSKDGSRYTMEVKKFKPNSKYAAADFVFNPEDYPDIFVEDLRIE